MKIYLHGIIRNMNLTILIWFGPRPLARNIVWLKLQTTAPRNIPKANEVVVRTLDIINYLNPTYFVLENPQTGYLKKQDFMQDRYYVDVDYCKYGMPYRKRTRLWNNIYIYIYI